VGVLGIYERIILKWILEKHVLMVWIEFEWLRVKSIGGGVLSIFGVHKKARFT
jgi:hypothetical protein